MGFTDDELDGDGQPTGRRPPVWVPAVNNAGKYDRWAYEEFVDIPYDIEDRLRAYVRVPALA